MPLTAKGVKVMKVMKKTYKDKGGNKKAKQVFYSMVSEGKLTGVEGKPKKKIKKK